HARFHLPDRRFGYCTDDNARALLVLVRAARQRPDPGLLPWMRTHLSFLLHAWNPEAGRFRNFLGYDRRWLE
ncbi:MAG: hypothetical protein C4314_02410, partial [Thermoflexus sp.]